MALITTNSWSRVIAACFLLLLSGCNRGTIRTSVDGAFGVRAKVTVVRVFRIGEATLIHLAAEERGNPFLTDQDKTVVVLLRRQGQLLNWSATGEHSEGFVFWFAPKLIGHGRVVDGIVEARSVRGSTLLNARLQVVLVKLAAAGSMAREGDEMEVKIEGTVLEATEDGAWNGIPEGLVKIEPELREWSR